MTIPLHALIAQWRDMAISLRAVEGNMPAVHGVHMKADAYAACASELEALLASSAEAQTEDPTRTLEVIATMLGWMNVPPRRVFEAEIRAMKARIKESALRDEEGQQKIGESLGMSGNILVEGWNTGRPPDRVLVEVEVIGPERTTIERVRAVWGSVPNGVRPHWESEDGDTLWSADAFSRWRPVVASGVTK